MKVKGMKDGETVQAVLVVWTVNRIEENEARVETVITNMANEEDMIVKGRGQREKEEEKGVKIETLNIVAIK